MVKSPLPSLPGLSVYASAAHPFWAARPMIPATTQLAQSERKVGFGMDKELEHLGGDSSGKWNRLKRGIIGVSEGKAWSIRDSERDGDFAKTFRNQVLRGHYCIATDRHMVVALAGTVRCAVRSSQHDAPITVQMGRTCSEIKGTTRKTHSSLLGVLLSPRK
jgi:hypothetical protein